MIKMTALQLLADGPLFTAFSTDPEDLGWNETEARQWCTDHPHAVVTLDGDQWSTDLE